MDENKIVDRLNYVSPGTKKELIEWKDKAVKDAVQKRLDKIADKCSDYVGFGVTEIEKDIALHILGIKEMPTDKFKQFFGILDYVTNEKKEVDGGEKTNKNK